MSGKDTKRKAEYLLDEIGGIDDFYLDESIRYRSGAARNRFGWTHGKSLRVLLVAASLVLVLAVGTAAMLTMFRRNNPGDASHDYSSNGGDKSVTELARLDSLLQACTQSEAFRSLNGEEPDYFDGTVRLTVENRETGERYVSRPLTDAEQSALRRDFLSYGTPVPDDAEQPDYLVWVLLGDGSVVTPCLNPSEGNIGAAVLFDYDPERSPTQYFTDLLAGMQ